MSKDNNYITMLGTGNALATRCYNTCYTLDGRKANSHTKGIIIKNGKKVIR